MFSESGSSDPFRVAAVGDSITWGFGLEKRYENSWPAVVESLSGGRFETGNFGRNGATLTDLGDRPYKDTAQYSRALEFNADVVVIALGTNDTKIGNRIFLDSFKEDYLELIGAFRQENEPRDIYLCLPPPVFHNRWGMEGSLLDKCLIPLIREIAEESGCQVIDLHYPLLDHQEYFADGVHPDGRGARMIGELIFKQIMN
nr:GDSL-type esterase/lipase family protein [Spirochaeta isovalerica]